MNLWYLTSLAGVVAMLIFAGAKIAHRICSGDSPVRRSALGLFVCLSAVWVNWIMYACLPFSTRMERFAAMTSTANCGWQSVLAGLGVVLGFYSARGFIGRIVDRWNHSNQQNLIGLFMLTTMFLLYWSILWNKTILLGLTSLIISVTMGWYLPFIILALKANRIHGTPSKPKTHDQRRTRSSPDRRRPWPSSQMPTRPFERYSSDRYAHQN